MLTKHFRSGLFDDSVYVVFGQYAIIEWASSIVSLDPSLTKPEITKYVFLLSPLKHSITE